jgi:hypothetical protein
MRSGLTVVSFHRSRLKLFWRKFSCSRTLFLSFENNNFFPNSGIASELYGKIRETCLPRGEFKHRHWVFADTPNIARNCRVTVFEKIYDGEPILTVVSTVGEDII